jgi:hypothetical protein
MHIHPTRSPVALLFRRTAPALRGGAWLTRTAPALRGGALLRIAIAALLLVAPSACRDDEPDRGSRSAGGENALDRAGRKLDTAHQKFKRKVRPAAQVVDEKTKKAVGEGKKAVEKSADAVDEAVD